MIWGLLIPGWLKRGLAWAVAAGAVALGIFTAGKREARKDAKADALKAKAKTTERVQNAQTVDNPADARDRLRELGK